MKHILIIIVCLAELTTVCGQGRGMNAISTAGSSIESNDLVISWTIGEDLIDFTLLDAAMTNKPGYNPNVLEMKDGTLLKVYPTLTTGLITVELRGTEQTDLQIELLDLKGAKLKVIDVEADKLTIDLSEFVQGGYYLRISNQILNDLVIVRVTKV
ncbi:MAG: hypothetical protein IH591_09535 [Bacteroidales bacterium]|nr:hypothetical protein [Bacteroidales bacterium]